MQRENAIDWRHRRELLKFLLVKTAAVRQGVKPAELLRVRHCYEGVNSVGLHRRGFTDEQINRIQNVYRMLYLSGLNISDAVAKIEAEIPDWEERKTIVNFIRASRRGIIRMGI